MRNVLDTIIWVFLVPTVDMSIEGTRHRFFFLFQSLPTLCSRFYWWERMHKRKMEKSSAGLFHIGQCWIPPLPPPLSHTLTHWNKPKTWLRSGVLSKVSYFLIPSLWTWLYPLSLKDLEPWEKTMLSIHPPLSPRTKRAWLGQRELAEQSGPDRSTRCWKYETRQEARCIQIWLLI